MADSGPRGLDSAVNQREARSARCLPDVQKVLHNRTVPLAHIGATAPPSCLLCGSFQVDACRCWFVSSWRSFSPTCPLLQRLICQYVQCHWFIAELRGVHLRQPCATSKQASPHSIAEGIQLLAQNGFHHSHDSLSLSPVFPTPPLPSALHL